MFSPPLVCGTVGEEWGDIPGPRSLLGFRACVLSYSILSYLVRGLILILILNHEARCGSRIALSGG